MQNSPDTHFGRENVSPDERQKRIRKLFDTVAPRYDLMNDVMSFGIHRLWKRRLVNLAAPKDGQTLIDLAGGTGDVALSMAKRGGSIIVCDPSRSMMAIGQKRKGAEGIRFTEGTAESMPFDDGSIDAITMAFGLRNVTRLGDALKEIKRVLKPGGRFLCLEFSRPFAPIRPFYDAYSFVVIPRLGAWIGRDAQAYHYLVDSIRGFPHQDELAQHMRAAGFTSISWTNLSFGIACIHIAQNEPS
ncbi:MAG: bifunctional demethylmenaquinone methyltransferase/2-methoxy-6-polyprenyl-1,4-benzoquinol methylase UbiE [Alphaproteobacteria bacterium]|nr:bifunctional demethylmenaquinone methyltransferase/2-methoxy-6-polyprenyl-1,4-benzoquinol methylase UbiE [Alphaproteobacteria bacterium]